MRQLEPRQVVLHLLLGAGARQAQQALEQVEVGEDGGEPLPVVLAVARRHLLAVEEAVAHYRGLAGRHPLFRADLADALTTRGMRLTDLGAHDEALAADREALSLYRELAAIYHARYESRLEQAARNLVVDLRGLGRSDEEIEADLNRLLPPED